MSKRLLLSTLVALLLILLVGGGLLGIIGCQKATPEAGPTPAPSSKPTTTPSPAKIVLKAATAWPKGFNEVLELLNFIEFTNSRGAGKLEIEHIGGPEVIKPPDLIEACGTGTVDIVMSSGGYYSGIVPEAEIVGLPVVEWRYAYETWDLFHKLRPKLNKLWAEKTNTKLLSLEACQNFYLYTSKKPINALEDLKGLKIRSVGGVGTMVLTALDATPITMPAAEVYLSLERGTIDGGLRPHSSLIQRKEHEVLKYGVETPVVQIPAFIWINLDTWNKLPEELQQIIEGAAKDHEFWAMGEMDYLDFTSRQELISLGVKYTTLTQQEMARWRERLIKASTDLYLKNNPKTGQEFIDIALGK